MCLKSTITFNAACHSSFIHSVSLQISGRRCLYVPGRFHEDYYHFVKIQNENAHNEITTSLHCALLLMHVVFIGLNTDALESEDFPLASSTIITSSTFHFELFLHFPEFLQLQFAKTASKIATLLAGINM